MFFFFKGNLHALEDTLHSLRSCNCFFFITFSDLSICQHRIVSSSHPGSVVHHPLTVIWTINR